MDKGGNTALPDVFTGMRRLGSLPPLTARGTPFRETNLKVIKVSGLQI